MAVIVDSRPEMSVGEFEKSTTASERVETLSSASKPPPTIEVTRLPDDFNGDEPTPISTSHSTYYIYTQKECYKLITLTIDPTKERRCGPTIAQQKARRADEKERKASGLPPTEPDDTSFFLHRPYLAFHVPPHVLYTGNSKRSNTPAVLIHSGCFWRSYKLQLGPSINAPGVLDPRGVVAWKHNGGDKAALKADAHKLKGYKVRTWRLWGETGKQFVHCVKRSRATGEARDPDKDTCEVVARADEVVHLRWTSPLSLHTRRYSFTYRGVDFVWKGTGTVNESRKCGLLLRFNHLKLVATVPLKTTTTDEEDKGGRREICLGKFTSSVAKEKNGTLELYDAAIWRLAEEYMPGLLERDPLQDKSITVGEELDHGDTESDQVAQLKKGTLYQVIIATAMCMITSEKEKRHTLLKLIMQAGEGGGGAG